MHIPCAIALNTLVMIIFNTSWGIGLVTSVNNSFLIWANFDRGHWATMSSFRWESDEYSWTINLKIISNTGYFIYIPLLIPIG